MIILQTISTVIYFNQTYKPAENPIKGNEPENKRINKKKRTQSQRKMIQSRIFGLFCTVI